MPIAAKNSKLPDGTQRLQPLRGRWDEEGDYFLIAFEATNSYARQTCINAARLKTRGGKQQTTVITHVTNASLHQPGEAILGQEETIHGVVAVKPDPGLSLTKAPHLLELLNCSGQSAFASHLRGWRRVKVEFTVYPLTAKDDWLKEVAEEEARLLRAKQLILGPRVFFGAFWLSNGLKGEDRNTEATTFRAGGLRLTKGLSENFAFETEASGGTTGEVTFDLDGQQLKRKAKFGRVHIGAALRFGAEKVIPTARIGIGVQGTSYDSDTVGTEPDDGVEFSTFVAFGGGVDYRLSQQFMGGISLAVVTPFGAEDSFGRTIGAGIHLGYGWNP